jgi:hypothetical protein
VPISRLFAGGEPNEEMLRIVRANVRTPFEVADDLYAQAGSNEVGGTRLLEMMEEFKRWPLGDGLPERHPGHPGGSDREHLPRRHAQARAAPGLRGCGPPPRRPRSGDGAVRQALVAHTIACLEFPAFWAWPSIGRCSTPFCLREHGDATPGLEDRRAEEGAGAALVAVGPRDRPDLGPNKS